MSNVATSRVEACVVNHNTSEFAELALRTLVATHQQRLAAGQLRVTVVDNHSTDDGLSDLVAAAGELGATFQRSRWPAASTPVNSHGDVLRDFVAAHDQATHVFFVDADVVFTSPDPRHHARRNGRRSRCLGGGPRAHCPSTASEAGDALASV
jgi:hypothetical protein